MTVRPTDRPSTLQAYQCKLAQSTGMATQMQLEDISPGNGIATRVLWSRDNQRVNKYENGKQKLFLCPYIKRYNEFQISQEL